MLDTIKVWWNENLNVPVKKILLKCYGFEEPINEHNDCSLGLNRLVWIKKGF